MDNEVWSFRPRNDYVLIRIVEVGETPSGIAIPQISIEGKEFHIVALGPKVEDLKIGDKVLMVGQQGVDFFPLPRSKDLIMIREEHVVLVVG